MEEMKSCPYCGCQKMDVFPTLVRVFFAVRCAACRMYGPHAGNEDCAVERWNALPRRLRWTKEKPTKNGWYWHHQGASFGTVIEFVDMEIGPTGGVLEDEMWAGPIPEPE